VYDNNKIILYETKFNFQKGILYWIGLDKLNNIIINILDQDDIIYSYENINEEFVYITCGDLYYMDIIEKLVISLLNVSSNKIIVYGINCKIPFDYPNLIKREFISPIKTVHDKWFWKQKVCIESLKENFNNYVWIDGDIIANINIDSVSKYFSEINNYPLCEIHVQDEQIFDTNKERQFMGEKISKYFGYNRKILKKDLHACFFVFNKNCKWFFEEILDTFNLIYSQGLYDELLCWNDESLHNFMHSKYNFTKTLPLSNLSLLCDHSKYKSNPQLLRLFYGYWNEDSPNNFGDIYGWSYVPADKNQILYFHENKNLNDADEMINFIKMKKNNSFNDSKWLFINKYKIYNFEKNNCSLFEYKNMLNLEAGDVVLDIGSDIGFFERYSYLKKVSKIICFEPDKNKFELLKLNSHKDSILFNADVTNEIGEYIIETEIKDEIVNTYNINYLFNAELINKIDFLKIDSYGKENLIIKGIDDNILKKINKISIKWYDFNLLSEEQKNEQINIFLKTGMNYFVVHYENFTMLYLYRK
jgi:FkbM family methyltransferase